MTRGTTHRSTHIKYPIFRNKIPERNLGKIRHFLNALIYTSKCRVKAFGAIQREKSLNLRRSWRLSVKPEAVVMGDETIGRGKEPL